MKSLTKLLAVCGVAGMLLPGCTVGPNFRSPEPVGPETYTKSPLPEKTATAQAGFGKAQRFSFAKEVTAQWWTLFRSAELNSLIRKGLADSPSLAAADAALRVAEENLRAAGGALLYPNINAGLQATRERSPGLQGAPASEYSLYNASVSVSYTLDLFGGVRRQLEALGALVDYQRFQYEAAYLALAANIVTTAIQQAALASQMDITKEIISEEEKSLSLVKEQFQVGAVSRAAVLSQESQLASARATLPPLEKQLAFTRHALAVLIGQLPSQAEIPEFNLKWLTLPEVLPLTLPSDLIRQRPDIRAAEALLHQASAEVGVATANLLPNITLSAGYGVESTDTGDLFTGQNVLWNIVGNLVQPLFHGGELEAKKRAAVDAFEQAAGQYRQTVLTAFQQVADTLRALQTDAEALRDQAAAEADAKATLDLVRTQFKLGAVSYLPLLIAERDYNQAQINLTAAQASRFADTAALFQALGGGWWSQRSAETSRTAR